MIALIHDTRNLYTCFSIDGIKDLVVDVDLLDALFISFTVFVLINTIPLHQAGADLGGGCRGCAPPPPQDDLWFSNTTGILEKKNYVVVLVLK